MLHHLKNRSSQMLISVDQMGSEIYYLTY